jgi:hypothetical protein
MSSFSLQFKLHLQRVSCSSTVTITKGGQYNKNHVLDGKVSYHHSLCARNHKQIVQSTQKKHTNAVTLQLKIKERVFKFECFLMDVSLLVKQ